MPMANTQRAQPGAWKGQNGPRILTEAQRERKRQKDRITKREEKLKIQNKIQELEKTNNLSARRIQELEAQVRSLLETCRCEGNTGCASCQNAYNQLPGLSPSYHGTNEHMTPVLESSASPYGSMSVSTDGFLQPRHSHDSSNSSPASETSNIGALRSLHMNDPNFEQHEMGYSSLPYHSSNQQKSSLNDGQKSQFPRLSAKLPRFLDAEGFDLTNILNGLVSMARSYKGNPNIVEDNNITYDFCIRALLCGWDEAWEEYQGQLCPLWPLLQWADEHIWKTTPFLVRLAYLRQSHCIMLSFLTQKPIPKWLLPRMAQTIYPHPPVLDCIAHPFLRDRLIQINYSGQRPILTNKSWQACGKSLKFNFPVSESAILFDSSRKMYHFSPAFDLAWNDINNYTFGPELFVEYPDLVEPDNTLQFEMQYPLHIEPNQPAETTNSGDGYILEEEEQKYTPPKSEEPAYNTTSELPLETGGDFNNQPPESADFSSVSPTWQLKSM